MIALYLDQTCVQVAEVFQHSPKLKLELEPTLLLLNRPAGTLALSGQTALDYAIAEGETLDLNNIEPSPDALLYLALLCKQAMHQANQGRFSQDNHVVLALSTPWLQPQYKDSLLTALELTGLTATLVDAPTATMAYLRHQRPQALQNNDHLILHLGAQGLDLALMDAKCTVQYQNYFPELGEQQVNAQLLSHFSALPQCDAFRTILENPNMQTLLIRELKKELQKMRSADCYVEYAHQFYRFVLEYDQFRQYLQPLIEQIISIVEQHPVSNLIITGTGILPSLLEQFLMISNPLLNVLMHKPAHTIVLGAALLAEGVAQKGVQTVYPDVHYGLYLINEQEQPFFEPFITSHGASQTKKVYTTGTHPLMFQICSAESTSTGYSNIHILAEEQVLLNTDKGSVCLLVTMDHLPIRNQLRFEVNSESVTECAGIYECNTKFRSNPVLRNTWEKLQTMVLLG